MTLLNPLILLYDIGFQLSFGALLGLVWFAGPFQTWLEQGKIPTLIAETLAATLGAQLTTGPIIAIYFQTFSLYSLVANLVVGPIIPELTVMGIPLVLFDKPLHPAIQLVC